MGYELPQGLNDTRKVSIRDINFSRDASALDPIPITLGDSPSVDAFGRLRVSNTGQRLDLEFLYNKQEEYVDEITTRATITHNANTRDLTLALDDASTGASACVCSYPVPYTPGNSQLVDITGVLDNAAIGGGTAEVFIRTKISGSVVETAYDQSGWSALTSGVDWSKSHIFSVDFQSLKVGRIQYAMVVSGIPVKVFEINNDNTRNSGYWQIANLPVYWKIYTSGSTTYMETGYGDDDNGIGFRYKISANASATLRAICTTVKSEGGNDLRDLPGLPRGIDNGVTPVSVSSTLVPILSIRPKTTFNSLPNLQIVLPKGYSISTDNPIRVVVLHDCVLSGASWSDVDSTESCIEYDVDASAVTNGHLITSEYVSTIKNANKSDRGFLGKTVLWNRLNGETGILTIAAVKTGATDASVLASQFWEEIR